jgi:hypothetical protein
MIREELEQLMSQGLADIIESDLMSTLDSYSTTLSGFERYEPLEFQVSEENL